MVRVSAPIDSFSGFGPQAVSFWTGLADDNSKAWFDAHRPVYEQDIRAPMEALLAQVDEEFGDGRVYRPNRDVRFTQDKSPYKEHCGALIQRESAPTAYYLHVSAEGLLAASGSHYMSRDQVVRLREAVDDSRSGEELTAILERVRADGLKIEGSTLKTAPRGFTQDHPRIGLLRHTSLAVHRSWPERRWLHTPEALRRVTTVWRAAADLNAWIDEHVGPAQEEPGPG